MNRARLFACSTLALAACASGSPQLTRVEEFTSSSKCARGGVRIDIGLDSNSNGTLDASETRSSTELCTGAQSGAAGPQGPAGPAGATGPRGTRGPSGLATLVSSSPLTGATPCANGGVRLDFGLDDGAGGGTAGNGVLETGEITRTRTVCNGGMPYYPGALNPPAAPAGAYTLDASGGAGDGSNGGLGGNVYVEIGNGSLGGHAKVFRTGAANAAFTVPALPAFVPGARPLAVSADLSLNGYPDIAAGLASSDAHFWAASEQRLYANVAGAAVEVTSLDIAAGVTLTLPHDGTRGTFVLHRDVRNAGHLRLAAVAAGSDAADLTLQCDSYYGLAGSTLRTDCAASTTAPGCAGGTVQLLTNRHLINQGEVSTRGGNGTTGGAGGAAYLAVGAGELFNTAAIDSSGGDGSAGAGGVGGALGLESYRRGAHNSGALVSNGGTGTTAGGKGGSASVAAFGGADLLNTGALTARGGSCSAVNCDGGSGGSVRVAAFSGGLKSNATLDVRGADGQGLGEGGSGGVIDVFVEEDTENIPMVLPVGSVQLSGNLITRGGTGDRGGNGGDLTVLLRATTVQTGQEIELLGYTTLTANGGNTVFGSAGHGGQFAVANYPSTWFGQSGPGGSAVLYPDVVARGGDGEYGGNGGSVSISSQTQFAFLNSNEVAELRAASLDLRGGIAFAGEAGRGGSVLVRGAMGAVNAAPVNANGGPVSEGPTPVGGNGGELIIESPHGAVSNSGAFSANGGSSSGFGGQGGDAVLRGVTVTNTATISCNGANGSFEGGPGGSIDLLSTPGNTTTANAAQLSVTPGTGALRGTILIDGVDVTP